MAKERNKFGAERHLQPSDFNHIATKPRKKHKKKINVPNEKMRVFVLAPNILGKRIVAGYARFIQSPSRDKKMFMSIDVELGDLTMEEILAVMEQNT